MGFRAPGVYRGNIDLKLGIDLSRCQITHDHDQQTQESSGYQLAHDNLVSFVKLAEEDIHYGDKRHDPCHESEYAEHHIADSLAE